MFKLNSDMKQLMAYCYSNDNIISYEFDMDKRDNYFACRIFIEENRYLLISSLRDNDGDISATYSVEEFLVVKSHFHPVKRVGILTKYFRKYKIPYHSYILATMPEILKCLDKIETNLSLFLGTSRRNNMHVSYVDRCTGRY